MTKKLCKETVVRIGEEVSFIWHPDQILDDVLLHQVYGFLVSQSRLVTLVRDFEEKRFTLPGGSIEKNETAEEAMIRECKEEAQFFPQKLHLLGTLEYINPAGKTPMEQHHQQVRYVAEIGDLSEFIPQKDGFETAERIFVYYKDVPSYISWMKKSITGKEQFRAFEEYFQKK